jgi:hypothetical protein
MMLATTNGNQPPSNTFIMLALTKERSTTMKMPAVAMASGRLQCQISRIARNSSTEVRNMVRNTAMPKAAARLSEERKPKVSAKVNTIRTQLTKPI